MRGGKAVIASERCIDCGECIRICPHHAKRARFTHLSKLSEFEYNIALPAPSLYGQFNNLDDIDYVLTGLKEMGFDDIFEVSRAAELVSEATRKLMEEGGTEAAGDQLGLPGGSAVDPGAFPGLVRACAAAEIPDGDSRRYCQKGSGGKTGLPADKIGCFFSDSLPCKGDGYQDAPGHRKIHGGRSHCHQRGVSRTSLMSWTTWRA